MRFWKLSATLLTACLVSSCSKLLEPFPATYVYSVKPDKMTCTKHKIINHDPVTVDKGVFIEWNECPHVFGFSDVDTPKVFSWIREAQALAKKKCKD